MEQQIEQAAAEVVMLGAYEWSVITVLAFLTGLASMALAIRDRQYRDCLHLAAIGCVGGMVGLGSIGFSAWAMGGVRGSELLLLFVVAGSGLGGRYIELAITKKTASLLGVDALGNDRDLFELAGRLGGNDEPIGDPPAHQDPGESAG